MDSDRGTVTGFRRLAIYIAILAPLTIEVELRGSREIGKRFFVPPRSGAAQEWYGV